MTDLHMLALVTELPDPLPTHLTSGRKWTELYKWLKTLKHNSEWAKRLISYMDVLESKLPREQYLTGGTLTVFAGMQFGKDNPYSYLEAKRVLRLAMDELRLRKDLQRELGVDQGAPGRSAITGRDSTRVWDFLRLVGAEGAENFTEFPHLTLAIHQEHLNAMVTVSHRIRSEFRRRLLNGGLEDFRSIFESILIGFRKSLGEVDGAIPWVHVVQRRYRTQRSEPSIDALLEFDLRTGFRNTHGWEESAKRQPQWLEASFDALATKNSNLQLMVGAKFQFEQCPAAGGPEILEHIANAWLACKPLIDRMIK